LQSKRPPIYFDSHPKLPFRWSSLRHHPHGESIVGSGISVNFHPAPTLLLDAAHRHLRLGRPGLGSSRSSDFPLGAHSACRRRAGARPTPPRAHGATAASQPLPPRGVGLGVGGREGAGEGVAAGAAAEGREGGVGGWGGAAASSEPSPAAGPAGEPDSRPGRGGGIPRRLGLGGMAQEGRQPASRARLVDAGGGGQDGGRGGEGGGAAKRPAETGRGGGGLEPDGRLQGGARTDTRRPQSAWQVGWGGGGEGASRAKTWRVDQGGIKLLQASYKSGRHNNRKGVISC
jgi:hypothetical protein